MSEKIFNNSKIIFAVMVFTLLAAHGWALYVSGYYFYPLLDVLMHFWGGAATGIFFVWFFYYSAGAARPFLGRFTFIVMCLGFSALVGVGWEFFEFSVDALILQKTNMLPAQLGMGDTMLDLLMDLLGSFTVGIIFIFSKAWQTRAQNNIQS